MKADAPQVAAAKIEAERARAQLMTSAQRLQTRISPKTLTHNAWQGAKEKGADLAENAVDAVRSRPLTAGAVVTAITLFLAREPLMHLAGKLADKASSKPPRKRTRKSTEKAE